MMWLRQHQGARLKSQNQNLEKKDEHMHFKNYYLESYHS